MSRKSALEAPVPGGVYRVRSCYAADGKLNDVAEFGPDPRAWVTTVEWMRERFAAWPECAMRVEVVPAQPSA